MTAALEDIKAIDIEEWKTLNTASSPTKLEQGMTPDAKNVWVDEKPGSVITSKGYVKVGTNPSNTPTTFCINYFKTSSGTQIFVLSDNSKVWTTLDFQNFTEIITGLSSSFQLRGMVIRDKLWLTNGSDSVRTFDGTTVTVLDGTGGTPNVPKGKYIGYHDERIWMYHMPSSRSETRFSALVNSSGTIIEPDNASAWPSDNSLQISEGDADFGTGILLYRGYLHFFKQYSIWRLVGYDEYTYSRVKTRASTGSRFNESVQVLDSLVHFIGVDGIYVFDGEETDRISDLIDPATASQTAFGFNELQQPNVNNQFWEVASTSDWNAGTVAANLGVNDQISLQPFDDSQSNFQAGTLTDMDATTNPGNLQLALISSGGSSLNISQGRSASRNDTGNNLGRFGTDEQITDGNFVNNVGFANSGDGTSFSWVIDLGSQFTVGNVTLKGFRFERADSALFYTAAKIQYSNNNTTWTDAATVTLPSSSAVSPSSTPPVLINPSGVFLYHLAGPSDLSINFSSLTARYWRFLITGNKGNYVITEMQVFQSGYKSSGTYTSRTLDLGAAPASLGNFNASYVLNGGGITFYTQSSNDGSTWDAAVAVTSGSAIGSTPRRYLRYRADFTVGASGAATPIIDSVYLPSQYFSAVHFTGGSIFAWGPFEADYSQAGQTIKFYYRSAITLVGVASASWVLIVPGGVVSDAVANSYIQFKIELLGATSTQSPSVQSVTINWVVGTGTQPQTLQNVASYIWRNRYWLSAAGPGAMANDTILIRGKKNFKSPWHLKDWSILSFTRFHDNFYGGSSTNGAIYRLDTGYSKDGSAMDSYFETGDFIFGGFDVQISEVLIEVERTGPYELSVGISTDKGSTFTDKTVDLTTSDFASTFIKKLNFNVSSDRFRLRVRTSGIDQPFQVHRIIVYYQVKKSRGSLR